ncbi:MAG: hypothetical protein U5J99_11860 [Parvularculaceae bacterium]|nr:hypothetical protein [Parvularculaceae bacterium]
MSRKTGAQAGEGRLESRFAALTSGLLARKGQAAPSNSPIIDGAEETEAFTLSDAIIPRKNNKPKGPSLSPLTTAPRAAPAIERPAVAKAASLKTAPVPAAPAPVMKAAPKPVLSPQAAPLKAPPKPAPPPQPLTVINERSFEAGYPDNPSAEDIAAMDAEADEVASYFEAFGGAEASPALDENFFDDEPAPASARDPLDDLDDLDDDFGETPPKADASALAPVAPYSGLRATVSALIGPREFMRLALGAAELKLSADELIAEAIEEYLDARGIDSLGGEDLLKKILEAGARAPQT